MFEYFGFIAVGLSWLIGGLIVWKWRIDNSKSISEHAASHRTAFILCALVLGVVNPLFYVWILQFVVKPLELGAVFVTALTLAIALQFVAGFVPDVPGWKRRVHRYTAYTMAFLFMPLSIMLTAASEPWGVVFWVGVIYVAYGAIGWYLYWFVLKAHQYYLLIQAPYIVVFQVQILLVAYS